MTTLKTLQMQLRLNNGTLILALIVDEDPIQIGFHYTAKGNEGSGGTCYNTPINPERTFLENQLLAALANPRVNETGKRIAPLILEAAQQLLEAAHAIATKDALTRMPEMDTEYKAWQDLVKEFKLINEDINDPKFNTLIQVARLWAERLVALRRKQTTEECSKALNYAKEMHNIALEKQEREPHDHDESARNELP